MIEGRVFDSIEAIGATAWDACFGNAFFRGALEGYQYHLAIERAGLAGFRFFYIAVFEGREIRGVAPAFITNYDLETTLDTPAVRRLIQGFKKLCPWFLRARLAALGSPCSEIAMLGCREGTEADMVADCLLATFERAARARGGALFAVKDLHESDAPAWTPRLKARGFSLIPGLPVARLPVTFGDMDVYMQALSHTTRKDMRRKLRPTKVRPKVRIERVTSLKGYETVVMALYRSTRERADMALEELTFAFFENVLTLMPGKAFCTLYFQDDTLLAANLLLHDDRVLIDKYFMMAPQGRDQNLYFVSWFDNVQYCLNRGLDMFQVGQAAYGNKLRLGARLSATHMAFRHQTPLVSAILRLLSPLFAGDSGLEGASYE